MDPVSFAQYLGQNMRRLRRARALTLKVASQRAKMHIRHWQKLEAGTGNPTVMTLCQVAGALDVDPASLVLTPSERRRKTKEVSMTTKHISVRLEETTIRRAEAQIPAFSIPGRPATLSDVHRALILIGLEEMEKREPRSAGRRRGRPLIRGGGNDTPGRSG